MFGDLTDVYTQNRGYICPLCGMAIREMQRTTYGDLSAVVEVVMEHPQPAPFACQKLLKALVKEQREILARHLQAIKENLVL